MGTILQSTLNVIRIGKSTKIDQSNKEKKSALRLMNIDGYRSMTHINPKPLDLPVSLFFITTQSMTSP